MIAINHQTPPLEEDDDDDDVDSLRMAIHKESGLWDLIMVLTEERLQDILQPHTLIACVVANVPGFGEVPPMCLSFLSASTRKRLTTDQLAQETADAVTKTGLKISSDYKGVLPVVISLDTAAELRRNKMTALTVGGHGSLLRKKEVPAWGRLENIVLFLAETASEAKQLLETLGRFPGSQVEETDFEDESMW